MTLSRRQRLASASIPDTRPARILTLNALVNSTGTGAYMAAASLFYTRFGGVNASQYGLGLALAGIVGIATTVPIGRLADRFGARRLLLGVTLWRAAGYMALAFVHGFPEYVGVLCVLYLFDRSAAPLTQTLVGQLMQGPERSRTMAFVRSVRNVGFAIGFAIAGVAIAVGSINSYRIVFFVNTATFIFVFFAIRRLGEPAPRLLSPPDPESSEVPKVPKVPTPPMRDLPFVGITFSNAILFLHDAILLSALPIWVADHTRSPAWTITVLLLINTAFAVLGQVRVSAKVTTLRSASRATSQSSVFLVGACLALTGSGLVRNAVGSLAILIVAISLLSMAELLHSAGGWQMSFDMSPEDQQGRYIAFFNAGFSASEILGPVTVLWLISNAQSWGWLPLAATFPAAAICSRAAALRAASRLEAAAAA